MIKNYFFLFLFFLSIPFFTEARWASQEDAGLRYDLWRSVIKVEKDGTYTEEIKFKVRILKDSAIDSFGNFLLTYNGRSQKLKVLSAKTIKEGKSFPVDSKFIEDKPLASSPSGFDQMRQILIAFPHVEVGSDVYLRYRYQNKIAPYEDFFSYSKTFGDKWYKKAEVEIQSDLPLYYDLNDPQDFFKLSYHTDQVVPILVPIFHPKNFVKFFQMYWNRIWKKKKYKLTLSLKQPLYKGILDEKYVFSNLDLLPWIEVASDKKWSGMVQHIVPKYQERIAEPLPEFYRDILKSAQKFEAGSQDQINFVISSLIEKIRYMGDWRPINGGHVPRSLSTIVKTGFGDCKDLSVSLSALLKHLGFKAQVALVSRSSAYHSSYEYTLPNKKAFNHAIVRAEIKDRVFWLDPTNFSVYSHGIFSDIADRPALILEHPNPRMLRTKKPESSEAELRLLRDFQITENDQVRVKGAIHFKGRSAISFAGASLNRSKESIDYSFIKYTGADISTLKEWTVGDYDLSSRIVKDFSVEVFYTMEKNNPFSGYKSQLGSLFFSPYLGDVQIFFIRTKDRVSDLFLGQPRRVVFISKLNNMRPLGNFNMDCHLESKWLEARRHVESVKPLTIKDIYEFKQAEVPVAEIKSEEFLKLQKDLKNCFVHFAMIYKKID